MLMNHSIVSFKTTYMISYLLTTNYKMDGTFCPVRRDSFSYMRNGILVFHFLFLLSHIDILVTMGLVRQFVPLDGIVSYIQKSILVFFIFIVSY